MDMAVTKSASLANTKRIIQLHVLVHKSAVVSCISLSYSKLTGSINGFAKNVQVVVGYIN